MLMVATYTIANTITTLWIRISNLKLIQIQVALRDDVHGKLGA